MDMRYRYRRVRSRPITAALLGLALAAGSGVAAAGNPEWQELQERFFELRFLGGKAFATEDKHGGGGFGVAASIAPNGWVAGAEVIAMSESSPFMGTARIQPLEEYKLMGVFAGRRWRTDHAQLTLAMGAGVLEGDRRTELQRTEVECKSWSFFGSCPQEDEIEVKYHGSRSFRAVSVNPLLTMEFDIGKHAALGLWVQALINAEQGLGVIGLTLGFGT